ncbi:RING finger protein [Wickerhamomyces ciferrii]|uniref:RING finger protein n=1 Tax=Wickerhamomyces ciferrii (strain ATCC 14091 / BCRC 22168 / CBS 111 / JCM 3599 / NBRC 0793 / NRRL Y-1031 F-60-10) TaxID=1206466 RepID=K0KQK9_WICCF|nr:RING finger protein [Wickerhamomyces ciferrii]CCH43548.1 RING finger protein [Wickerhamomyces ciferrii]
MSKYNPNVSAFVPNKQVTPSSSSSQLKQQKLNSNLSSHSAPPPSNHVGQSHGNGTGKNKKNKSRESKVGGGNNRKFSSSSMESINYEDFDLNLEDQVMSGNFKPKGRRGQVSINHLLEFSLPSREENNHNHTSIRKPRRRSNNDDKIHLKNDEFVNANYRFIVDYRNDYNGQILDPNLILSNNSILRVIVPRGNYCPICLTEDIIAPRMISCGHILCHVCLLSFLDSEPIQSKKQSIPKKYKECPLCSEIIKPDNIKPVLINPTDERFEIPKIGQDVILKLMAKPKENILPLPFGLNLNHSKIGNIPWYSDTELYPFARIMKGGLKFIIDNYEQDKIGIINQYEEDKLLYNDDGKYVFRAIKEIDTMIESYRKGFNDNFNEPNPLVNSIDSLSINENKNVSKLNDLNCFFFYQTSFNSQTRFFLSSLDIKVLLNIYGSYDNFPSTLLLKIDNIKYGDQVSLNNLKKFKYFGHLPIGTELAFIEINWQNMLSPEIKSKFGKELNDRFKKNLNKFKKEDFNKRKVDVEQELKTIDFYKNENEGWGNYDFNSVENFATLDDESFPLGDEENELPTKENESTSKEFLTTVWGTKIPKNKSNEDDNNDNIDDFETEELIRLAKEENNEKSNGSKKKGRKKKLLVLTSSSGRGY